MLAGDSITHGRAGDYTYRYWLWRGVRSVGADVDFVGPRQDLAYAKTSYLDPAFDRDHAAMAGSTTAYHLDRITEEVATHRPAVVVIMIGFNDLRVRTPEATAANIRTYVERVRAVDPAVDLVVGQVTTGWSASGGAMLQAETHTLNVLLHGLAAVLDTPESRVDLALIADGWDPAAHTWDGIHPTPTGQTRLAQRVADSLVRIDAVSARPLIDKAVAWPATYVVGGRALDRRIDLTWDATGIDAWTSRVRHHLVAPVRGAATTTGWSTGSQRAIPGLRAGGTYELQVQPRRGTMTGAWSRPVRVRASGRVPVVSRTTATWRARRLRVRWQQAATSDTYTVAYRTRRHGRPWNAWRHTARSGGAATLAVSRRTARAQVRITPRNDYLTGSPVTHRAVRPR